MTSILEGLPSNGWLTQEEADLLYKYAELCEGPILEVGSYHGRSTVLLSRLGRTVYAVDPFENFAKRDPSGNLTEAAFLQNTAGISNITLFRQKIEDWEVCPVGFAYLDGDHTYDGTIWQIQIAKKCKPKYIALHDVNDKGGGLQVKAAALRLLGHWLERSGRLAVFNG
jgi:hypothetical protein